MITITDTATETTVTVETFEVADTITPWFPEPTAEITEAIHSLQDAINAGGSHRVEALAVFLGLEIA